MTTKQTQLRQIAEVRRMFRDGEAERVRRGAGISQSELARTIGVASSTVSLWESGDRVPRSSVALLCWQILSTLRGLGPRENDLDTPS